MESDEGSADSLNNRDTDGDMKFCTKTVDIALESALIRFGNIEGARTVSPGEYET